MAKKQKATDKTIEELKKLIKQKKVMIGTERVKKALRSDKLAKVMVSSNCDQITMDTLVHYSKLTGCELVPLKYPNDELGVLCKKPFAISVLGVVK